VGAAIFPFSAGQVLSQIEMMRGQKLKISNIVSKETQIQVNIYLIKGVGNILPWISGTCKQKKFVSSRNTSDVEARATRYMKERKSWRRCKHNGSSKT